MFHNRLVLPPSRPPVTQMYREEKVFSDLLNGNKGTVVEGFVRPFVVLEHDARILVVA